MINFITLNSVKHQWWEEFERDLDGTCSFVIITWNYFLTPIFRYSFERLTSALKFPFLLIIDALRWRVHMNIINSRFYSFFCLSNFYS